MLIPDKGLFIIFLRKLGNCFPTLLTIQTYDVSIRHHMFCLKIIDIALNCYKLHVTLVK